MTTPFRATNDLWHAIADYNDKLTVNSGWPNSPVQQAWQEIAITLAGELAHNHMLMAFGTACTIINATEEP